MSAWHTVWTHRGISRNTFRFTHLLVKFSRITNLADTNIHSQISCTRVADWPGRVFRIITPFEVFDTTQEEEREEEFCG